MADFTTNSEEERLIGRCINGLGIEKLPKYYILRIALAKALSMDKLPLDSKNWESCVIESSERGKEYNLEQISAINSKQENFDTLLRALFYIRHKEEYLRSHKDIFKDKEVYLNVLAKYIRRGLYEIKGSYKSSDCFYQWCLDNLRLQYVFKEEIGFYYEDDNSKKLKDFFAKNGVKIEVDREVDSYRYILCYVSLLDETKVKKFTSLAKELSDVLTQNTRYEKRGDMKYVIFIPKAEERWHWLKSKELKEGLEELRKRDLKAGIFLGFDDEKKAFCFDMGKDPIHLFIAGSTGSGKSSLMRVIAKSLASNSNVDLYLIDPKRGEDYKNIPGLKYCEDPHTILDKLINEMDARITTDKYQIIIIDELAYLVETDKHIESKIEKIATMGRSSKIYLILGTQRPDSQIFEGQFRANIMGSIALKVKTADDSRIILRESGAEKLLGKGDMLVKIDNNTHHVYGVLDEEF